MSETRYTEALETPQSPGVRHLEGVVIRYGQLGQGPGGMPERFLPGAFGDVAALDIILNVQHHRVFPVARTGGGGLTLADSDSMLSLTADLGQTTAGREAHELVKGRILRGLSIEFTALKESMKREGWHDIRVIEQARLDDISIVDRPAYAGSTVEARRLSGMARLDHLATLRGKVRTGYPVDCRCSPGDCKKAVFEPGSLDENLTPALRPTQPQAPALTEPLPQIQPEPFIPPRLGVPRPARPLPDPGRPPDITERDILAIQGEYQNAFASTKRGTVRLWKNRDGDMEIAADVPDTARGQALVETARSVDMIARPVIDLDASDFIISADGVTATYQRARIRAILFGPSDAAAGWLPLYFQTDPEDDQPPEPEPRTIVRRRRVWL